MSTDARIERPKDDQGEDREEDDVQFADREDRDGTDTSFRQKGREIMKRFRDAFASLAE